VNRAFEVAYIYLPHSAQLTKEVFAQFSKYSSISNLKIPEQQEQKPICEERVRYVQPLKGGQKEIGLFPVVRDLHSTLRNPYFTKGPFASGNLEHKSKGSLYKKIFNCLQNPEVMSGKKFISKTTTRPSNNIFTGISTQALIYPSQASFDKTLTKSTARPFATLRRKKSTVPSNEARSLSSRSKDKESISILHTSK